MGQGKGYTDQDIAALRAAAAGGVHPRTIAKSLGRSESSIRVAASKRGIKFNNAESRQAEAVRKQRATAAAGGRQRAARRKAPKTIEDAERMLAELGANGGDPGQVSALKAFIELKRRQRTGDAVLEGMREDIRDWSRARVPAPPPGAGDEGR